MCDYFWQRMENDHGDLTDIVRAGGQSGRLPNAGAVFEPADDWQLPSSEPAFFPTRSSTAGVIAGNGFGDPFVSLGDPLVDPYPAAGSEFFDGAEAVAGAVVASSSSGCCDGVERFLVAPRTAEVSKVHQICAGAGVDSCSSSLPRMDHAATMQISSPRTPGIKRRKSQAKKVVCIPAPAAAASNRPTGEVVPSDLWAWRKYGQKPIKGSPYPRGYYRCSSSKGCSARKQVERSRTDPNMLVITYTSEHNHPWPTQRNALAGSIRSHPSKNAGILKSQKPSKEEDPHETTTHLIKQEATENMEKATAHQAHQGATDHQLDQLIHQSYRPMIPDDADQPDDFFSDLAELDSDPMSLIFSKAFMEAKADQEDKALPPFRMFD